jgi:hypothetical protein
MMSEEWCIIQLLPEEWPSCEKINQVMIPSLRTVNFTTTTTLLLLVAFLVALFFRQSDLSRTAHNQANKANLSNTFKFYIASCMFSWLLDASSNAWLVLFFWMCDAIVIFPKIEFSFTSFQPSPNLPIGVWIQRKPKTSGPVTFYSIDNTWEFAWNSSSWDQCSLQEWLRSVSLFSLAELFLWCGDKDRFVVRKQNTELSNDLTRPLSNATNKSSRTKKEK